MIDREYSLDEKIIGTWMDGKNMYQKTVLINSETTHPGGDKSSWLILDNTNIGLLLFSELMHIMDNGNVQTIPIGIVYNIEDNQVVLNNSSFGSNFELYITLVYTKKKESE